MERTGKPTRQTKKGTKVETAEVRLCRVAEGDPAASYSGQGYGEEDQREALTG